MTTSRSISSCFCSFSSTVERILCNTAKIVVTKDLETVVEFLTFTAMTVVLLVCSILLTLPKFPLPISPKSSKSSAVKSNI